jgi:excisionase family DNA binding protein
MRLVGSLLTWLKAKEGKGVGNATLTPPQVARRLGVNESKVRAWIDKGLLKAVNMAADSSGRRPH